MTQTTLQILLNELSERKEVHGGTVVVRWGDILQLFNEIKIYEREFMEHVFYAGIEYEIYGGIEGSKPNFEMFYKQYENDTETGK